MLSLSSVTSAPPAAPRPALMADAALRPAAAVARTIEPTTAVSKERSRVDTRAPDGLSRAEAAPATASPSVVMALGMAAAQAPLRLPSRPALNGTGVNAGAQAAPAAPRPGAARSPQAEPSQVQKAIDTQIKDFFGSVWKASGKAVDFLLGRPEPTAAQVAASQQPMSAIMWSLTAQPGSRFSQAVLSEGAIPAPAEAPDQALPMYSSRGTSAAAPTQSPGQLLNVRA